MWDLSLIPCTWNHNSRSFNIGPFDDDMANIIMYQLLYLDAVDPNKDIIMYVNSPGGSVTAVMAIFDTIRHIRPGSQYGRISALCWHQRKKIQLAKLKDNDPLASWWNTRRAE